MNTAPALQKLLDELERLPGIGAKSAQRIAYWMMNTDSVTVMRLAEAITEVKSTVHFCTRCYNYAEDELCQICQSDSRDVSRICVVSEPRDIAAIERTGAYNGLYHVLGGELAPMDGIGPNELHISELMARVGSEDIAEIILATNPNVEGETTAAYLARVLRPFDLQVSRLASGMPVGGELEYVDEITLARSIEERKNLIA